MKLEENIKLSRSEKFQNWFSLPNQNKIETNKKQFVCDSCDKAFKTNQELKQLKIIHTNEVKCTVNI